MPTYNSEKTIKRTLESVLKQTFTDFELIIINDGSEDSTLDIISQFNDSRFKVFSYENSEGKATRNRGIKVSVGKFVSFLDADDIWTADKLQSQLQALQKSVDTKVAYSWTDFIDENDEFLLSGTHITANGDVYEKLFLTNFLENGSNPLVDKEAILALGGFNESLNAAQDWEMWLRLADKYSFVAVPSVQILYRVSTNSMSSNLKKHEKACRRVLEKAYQAKPSLSKLTRRKSFTNLYKYLTCKALIQPFNRRKGLAAAIFLCKYIINDSFRLKHKTFTLKLLFKVAVIIILPTSLSTTLLTSMKSRANKIKNYQFFASEKFSRKTEY